MKIIKIWTVGVFAYLVFVAPFSGEAAGPFDGKWVGTAPDAGDCGPLVVTLNITDGKITGTVAGKHGSPPIDSGVVKPDGTAHVMYSPRTHFEGDVRFFGNTFKGSFATFCGKRETTGSRS
jgi:hypothetical protein